MTIQLLLLGFNNMMKKVFIYYFIQLLYLNHKLKQNAKQKYLSYNLVKVIHSKALYE